MQSVLIVVPCYNEARRLDVEAFARALDSEANLSFLFVNDGSTDDTLGVVQGLIERFPSRVTLHSLERNQGKAEAVRSGVLLAAELGAPIVGYWDADLATPLEAVPYLASAFSDTSVSLVLGSRVRLLGREVHRSPTRHYIGRAFATFASAQLRLPVYDTQCGAKLLRVHPDILALFGKRFETRWCFDVELLGRFAKLSSASAHRCVEVPLERWIDAPGSKIGLSQVPSIALEMVRLSMILRRS